MHYDDKSALEYAQDTLKLLQEMLRDLDGDGCSEFAWHVMKVRIDLSVHALQDLEDYIREVLPRRN